ncbi:hypothetical protein Taro_026430 [Colocasia esculenta]|uniref:Uncharacterized protein n=1 Tax=Colocasia esculenta TaxID=4460 RepID=A0A843VNJ7_COLES|nr:hypothetical protein [Colocasia esculenta]
MRKKNFGVRGTDGYGVRETDGLCPRTDGCVRERTGCVRERTGAPFFNLNSLSPMSILIRVSDKKEPPV